MVRVARDLASLLSSTMRSRATSPQRTCSWHRVHREHAHQFAQCKPFMRKR